MVKCWVCYKIEGRDKLLVLKLDFFIKHLGMRKCTIARPKIIVGQYFICPTNSHVKNDKLSIAKGLDIVDVQLENGGKVERKKKYIQFVAIWHLLKQGCPMKDFERLKGLFKFLKVENCPCKHWFHSTDWTMAEAMHNVVL
jgi:hypothetical protein